MRGPAPADVAPQDGPGDGLPRRKRTVVAEAVADSGDGVVLHAVPPPGPARSPDAVRALMSGLQAGTQRGRRDATGEVAGLAAVGAPAGIAGAVLVHVAADGGGAAGTVEDGAAGAVGDDAAGVAGDGANANAGAGAGDGAGGEG